MHWFALFKNILNHESFMEPGLYANLETVIKTQLMEIFYSIGVEN